MNENSAETAPALFEARVLRGAVVVSSGALIAFGAICWVAANWSAFHRLTRMELVAGLLAASALLAMAAPRVRVPALLVSAGAVGGLLALIGQSYPSGADAWQLFALWAALALPFALAARHDSVWSLWVLVASAAIALWRIQEHVGRGLTDWAPACGLALLLAIVVSPWLPLQRLTGRSAWAFRLAALGAIALIGWEGLSELFLRGANIDDRAFLPALALLVAICCALSALRPLEFGVLALAALGVDVLLVARLTQALMGARSDFGTFLVIGVLASLIVGASVVALREVSKRSRPSAGELRGAAPETEAAGFSWPLAALSGFGALLAAIPLLSAIGMVLDIEHPTSSTLLGLVLLAGSIALLRGGQAFGFRQNFGVIVALAALLLLTAGMGRMLEREAGFALCLVAVAASFFIPTQGVRSIFGFFAAGALIASLFARIGWRQADLAIAATSLVATAGAFGLAWLPPAERDDEEIFGQARGLLSGWTVASLAALVLLAGRPFLLGAGSLAADLGEIIHAPAGSVARATSILLAIVGPALLFLRRRDLATTVGVAVAAAGVALSVFNPTLGATIVVLACALLLPSRALSVAAGLAAIWIVSALYYSLSLPLAQKGYGLMALGALLGGVLLATRHEQTQSAPVRRSAASMALIALGLVATGALAGNAVRSAEDVIANGREVFIGLRPVDPRSLVQGDYMALGFDTGSLPAPRDVKAEIVVLGRVDARGVVTLAMPPEGAAPKAGPNEILARVRRKSGRWFVGTDAFYFEEGRGSDYANAKYGVFRVGADGRLLLVGLADKDLKKLP